MKKIFLENLPTQQKKDGKVLIKWKESIGYSVNFIYNEIIGEFKIIDYNNKNEHLVIQYLNNETFEIKTGNFKRCKLGKHLGQITSEFKIELGTIFKDKKRDLTVIDRRNIKDSNGKVRKFYKYRCNKCGFECGEHYKNGEYKEEHWINEGHLLRGAGCICCENKIIVPDINSIVAKEETHWMIQYFKGGYDEAKMYSRGSNKKINFICPDCGIIKDKELHIYSVFNNKSIGCSCGDGFTYPNKFMFNLLEQLDINFETEYNPDWIKPKKYDFYIESLNLIIEMDGGLGHGKKTHSKSNKTVEETLDIDIYKDNKAKEHGIEVIRIDADESDMEYLKNEILESKLLDIFDLKNIDWLKCEEFALKNIVKEVCEYWKNKKYDETTIDLACIFKLNRATIIDYLKKGTKLKWCEYNAKEEMMKALNMGFKFKSKKIEVFKNGISYGIYPSITFLSNNSECILGEKVSHNNISLICRDKKDSYNNFTFKYIS